MGRRRERREKGEGKRGREEVRNGGRKGRMKKERKEGDSEEKKEGRKREGRKEGRKEGGREGIATCIIHRKQNCWENSSNDVKDLFTSTCIIMYVFSTLSST